MADVSEKEHQEALNTIDEMEKHIDGLDKQISDLEDERDELRKQLEGAKDALDTIQMTAKDVLRKL